LLQHGKRGLLLHLQIVDLLEDLVELLGRRLAVGLRIVMPWRTCPSRPATRTMKNSSRLLAEIDRKRTRSSSGWAVFSVSSSTRLLNCKPGEFAVDEALGAVRQVWPSRFRAR
jgi:hypothetical protein